MKCLWRGTIFGSTIFFIEGTPPAAKANQAFPQQGNQQRSLMSPSPAAMHGTVSLSNVLPSSSAGSGSTLVPDDSTYFSNENIPNLSFSLNPPKALPAAAELELEPEEKKPDPDGREPSKALRVERPCPFSFTNGKKYVSSS